MNFDRPSQPIKPKEAPKREIGGFEAFLTVLGYTRVIEHFVETKQGEIREVVKQAQKGTKNPVLLGDRILNATSKFMNIVTDYQLETERDRANLQNDTISSVQKMMAKAEEAETLGRQRVFREADLHDTLHGRHNEQDTTEQVPAGVQDLTDRYSKIDFNRELSEDEKKTVEAFREMFAAEMKKAGRG